MSGGGILWGSITGYFGYYWQSIIPLGYTFLTILNLSFFKFTKKFEVVRFFQVLISLLLPFFFQWSLGGFAVTGSVMLWALLSLVGSITFQSTRLASNWLIAYILFTILSGFLDSIVFEYGIKTIPEVITFFFVINIIVISGIVVGLMLYFVNSRDQANQKLIHLTDQLEEIVKSRTIELNEALAHLNAIIDNMADGLMVTDIDGKITRVNKTLTRLYKLDNPRLYINEHTSKLDPEIARMLFKTMKEHSISSEEISLPGNRIALATTTCILESPGKNSTMECYGSVTIIRDITREKEIDAMKTDFISNVSHELRTPLTSVLGFAKIISKKFSENIQPNLPDEKKIQKASDQIYSNLNIIVEEGQRLTELINSLLDIAKMEAGKTEWNFKEIQIREVIDRATAATSALFEMKQSVELILDIPENLPVINADKDRLIQVIINLISNSIKFTENGSIRISVEANSKDLMIHVQDSGIGIKAEDLEKVFDKFQQVGDTLTDKPKGTGLGLPICKQIISHHNGSITVKSEIGKGSIFTVQIPHLESNVELLKKKDNKLDLEALIASLNSHMPQDNQSLIDSSTKGKNILVTDDDDSIRILLKQELTEAGFNVIEARDGFEATIKVKMERIDLIILDVMMPKMNGFDAAAVIKNDPETSEIPILIHSIVNDRERGYKLGIDKYIPKTGDTGEIINEVNKLIRQGHSQKKILILDESESTINSLVELLNARGYSVTGAITGEEGIRKAMEIKPDLLIVDAGLSHKSELIKTLRFEKGMEDTFFLILGENNEAN